MNTLAMKPGWRMPPLLKFGLLGAALWLGKAYIEWREFFFIEAPSDQALEIDYQDWAQRAGVYPDDRQRKKILRTELEDRALFKEAVRRQLYLDDPLVYQRLLRNAEFIGIEGDEAEKIQAALSLQLHLSDELIRRHLIEKLKTRVRAQAHPIPPPGNALLLDRYRAAQDKWKLPPSIEMEHIFFSADSADLNARLQAARIKLDAVPQSGEAAYALGGRFLFGNRLPWMQLPKLKDTFGREFAEAVQVAVESGSTKPGASGWYGPVQSAYGFHFVRIISYREPSHRDFEDVKGALIHEYEQDVERDALEHYVSGLLGRYEVKRS